jgi:predicted ArsR family transcriptional regulator
MREIAVQITAQVLPTRSPARQIQQAIRWLNHHHYHARWEASATGARIILDHCPYLALLPEYPNICKLDIAIITRLNNQPMELTNQWAECPTQPYPCIFSPATN